MEASPEISTSACSPATTGASYGREVPKDKHLTGKIFTQRIERNNLTLRTRIKRLARKTICFSRSVEIHEKVIGTFIEKHMFY
ncbi:Transposase [Shigella dysenteriae 1617]|uniref:Transposase n=1 Tax=Shigella dysenteriae 1617 TaxID=754093 RepID=A0A0A7A0Q5_SHIDY|nr:Transposase [Shigella dysenteriae 1617]